MRKFIAFVKSLPDFWACLQNVERATEQNRFLMESIIENQSNRKDSDKEFYAMLNEIREDVFLITSNPVARDKKIDSNEAAEYLGCPAWAVRNACRKGKISAFKMDNGRKWKIPMSEIHRIVKEGIDKYVNVNVEDDEKEEDK